MSDTTTPTAPTEPTPSQLQQQIQELANQNTLLQIQAAKDRFFREHPHIPADVLDDFQGGPEAITSYGNKLAERWPKPAQPPAPLTQAPSGEQPSAPPLGSLPVASSESTRVPTPSPQDVMTQQNADAAKAEDIRAKMSQGLATQAEARWLSQWGPTGFTAAVRRLGAETRAKAS